MFGKSQKVDAGWKDIAIKATECLERASATFEDIKKTWLTPEEKAYLEYELRCSWYGEKSLSTEEDMYWNTMCDNAHKADLLASIGKKLGLQVMPF